MSTKPTGGIICRDDQHTRTAGAICCDVVFSFPSADTATWIFLHGPLGAGKSTFVRGFLTQAGISGPMPSPSYSLVEPYQVKNYKLYHLDAYRLSDAAELEFLGLDQMYEATSIVLVEWPGNIATALPAPSIEIFLDYYEIAQHPEGRQWVRSMQFKESGLGPQALLRSELWAEFDQIKF